MIADPAGMQAESIRKLKTSIEFLNLDRHARTFMLTSAVPREGKSTTAANLGVAFARAGRRVVLVDLDLRRPTLHSLLVTGLEPGIADVVAGKEALGRALRTVSLPAVAPRVSRNGSGRSSNGRVAGGDAASTLSVLPAGIASAVTGTLADFLESPRLAAALDELASEFELVILDTPPLLAVGDAIALTTHVDALLLVLQAQSQRPLLRELSRQLRQSQAPTLGFVLTGIDEAEAYGGYGYGYGYGEYTYDFESAGQVRDR
jgi:Mrp family chromosome partitioning ATPase